MKFCIEFCIVPEVQSCIELHCPPPCIWISDVLCLSPSSHWVLIPYFQSPEEYFYLDTCFLPIRHMEHGSCHLPYNSSSQLHYFCLEHGQLSSVHQTENQLWLLFPQLASITSHQVLCFLSLAFFKIRLFFFHPLNISLSPYYPKSG